MKKSSRYGLTQYVSIKVLLTKKNHHVQQMSSVYCNASTTRVFLNTDVDFPQLWDSRWGDFVTKQPTTARQALMRVLDASYWTRFWVMQEIIASNHVTVNVSPAKLWIGRISSYSAERWRKAWARWPPVAEQRQNYKSSQRVELPNWIHTVSYLNTNTTWRSFEEASKNGEHGRLVGTPRCLWPKALS